MKFQQIILLICVWSVYGYPSRPLNDRPGELAWQAWLLVDSQNHPTEGDRRITPKSVFIAPKLGQKNDTLPDCAEGYQADAMGRCIKFVKVDQAAHLNFLLQRLNAVYATKPDEDESDDDSSPTPGPLQVNIPLGTGFSSGEEPDSNPEIAIIVAPTNGNFDVEDEDGKMNVKRTNINVRNNTGDDDKLEESQFFLGGPGGNPNYNGADGDDDDDTGAYDGEENDPDGESNQAKDDEPINNDGDVNEDYDEGGREESSTKFEGEMNTEKVFVNNDKSKEVLEHMSDTFVGDNKDVTRRHGEANIKPKEVTTGANEEDSTEEPTSTTDTPSTSDNLQALFFLVPINNSSHVRNNRTANSTASSDTPIASHTNSTGNRTPVTSDTEPSAVVLKAKSDTETQAVEDLATLIEPVYPEGYHLAANFRNRPHLVRNPVSVIDHSTERILNDRLIHRPIRNRPSSLETHNLSNEQIEELFKDFIQEIRSTEPGNPYQDRPLSYPNEHSQIQRPTYGVSFNHRNRDRNNDFWKIPSEPREQNFQKPLVLRFERHPHTNFHNRYNTELYSPDNSEYYEGTTRGNIPNIFTRRSRRNHFR